MHFSCFTILGFWNKPHYSYTRKPERLFQAQFPSFCLIRAEDPIFSLATPLRQEEVDSHTREVIAPLDGQEDFLPDSGEQAEEATAVQGGWFGRGYGKGRKKKKKAA